MNIEKLDEGWAEQKRFLKDGLTAGAIWGKSTGLQISGIGEERPEFVALFSGLVEEIDSALVSSGFPGLNRFLIINMQSVGQLIVVLKHDDETLQLLALDPKKTNLGMLFSVAIPKALASFEAAKS